MASPVPSVDIDQCIAAECAALKQCVEMLNREQQLLMDGDVESLAGLNDRKAALLESAAQLSSIRERCLLEHGLPADREGMNSLLRDRPALHTVWEESLEWARQANILNRVNGTLIEVRLNHNRYALSVMHQGAKSHATYGQDGHIQHSNAGRALAVG